MVLAVSHLMRHRTALVLGSAALAGWITQIGMISLFDGTERVGTSFTFEEKLVAFANSSLRVVPGLRAFSNTPVSFLSVSTRLFPILVVIGVFAIVGWLILIPRDRKSSEDLLYLVWLPRCLVRLSC
jgi:hypothetical protein